MKDIIKNRLAFIGLLVFIFTIIFSSCSDEESYDFPGDSTIRVFMRNNSFNYQFTHTPLGSMSNLNFKTPIYTTLEATAMIKAKVEVDNTLIEAYNEKNGKDFKAIPDKALVIKNGTVTILKGAMHSSDSIHVTINESALPELRDEKGYLIPLKLTTVEGAVASTNVNYLYLTATTFLDDDIISDNSTDGDVWGTLVKKRDAWTACVVEPATVDMTGEFESLFDGDRNTKWYAKSSEPFSFIVDMQKEYDATGISAYYTMSGNFDIASMAKGFKIEFSKNSTEWFDIGIVPLSGRKNVVFNGPVVARYFKLTVPLIADWFGNKSASVQIGEFSIYVK